MKALGLIVVLFGATLAYLVGWKCYTLKEFGQELVNFTKLGMFGLTPGTAISPSDCPRFGSPSVAKGQ